MAIIKYIYSIKKSLSFNPLSAGIQFCKVLQGGSIQCPPPKIKQNEAKWTSDGYEQGFLWMPNIFRPFPVGCKVYFMCLHMSKCAKSVRTDLWKDVKYMWQTFGNSLYVSSIPKIPYFDQSHDIIASEIKITLRFWYSKMTPGSERQL